MRSGGGGGSLCEVKAAVGYGGKEVDIRDYEYIVQIAEHRSISKAAASLFITQSALTKFLQKTEKNLGVPLFVRQGHQFLLTEIGRDYVETGRVIMKLDSDLMNKLRNHAATMKKQIRFGAGMGLREYVIQNLLRRFTERYPDMRINLMLDTSRHLMMQLENETLDMAVVTNMEDKPGYEYVLLENQTFSLAVPEDSELLAQAVPMEGYAHPVISIRGLKGQRFVMLSSVSRNGTFAAEILRKYMPDANVSLEVTDINTLYSCIAAGYGVGILFAGKFIPSNIKLLSIRELDCLENRVNLVFRQDKALSGPMRAMIKMFSEDPEEQASER